jgi:mRNA interferase RelE/StbE
MAGRVSSVGAVGTARVGPPAQQRILRSLHRLATDPRSASSVKALKGGDEYRLRVGDWRVVYTLHDDVLTVLVVRIAHRREVYR